jgi:hypothetical protein
MLSQKIFRVFGLEIWLNTICSHCRWPQLLMEDFQDLAHQFLNFGVVAR